MVIGRRGSLRLSGHSGGGSRMARRRSITAIHVRGHRHRHREGPEGPEPADLLEGRPGHAQTEGSHGQRARARRSITPTAKGHAPHLAVVLPLVAGARIPGGVLAAQAVADATLCVISISSFA